MTIRIATRTSALALYQAHAVRDALQDLHPSLQIEIVGISTKGDRDQVTSLKHLGQTGVFTKALDDALLNDEADIAVHSLKDYPTQVPNGLELIATLKRDGYWDAFIPAQSGRPMSENLNILSGSPRRRAQWLAKYPNHTFSELRGNMDTRLEKIQDADGGIVSAVGLDRLNMLPDNAEELQWMVPAPAQGVVAVIGRSDQPENAELVGQISDLAARQCSQVERDFMSAVEAGCASPLGALAMSDADSIKFEGILLSLDGKQQVKIEESIPRDQWQFAGKSFAAKVLELGGDQIMKELESQRLKEVLCLTSVSPEQRKYALDRNIQLFDLQVLELTPEDFIPVPSEVFAIASQHGAQRILSRLNTLPQRAWTVGDKAKEALEVGGFGGAIESFRSSNAMLEHWRNCGKPLIAFYGAEKSSIDWAEHGISHVVTYRNSPTLPKLSRQNWDGIAAFSPMGFDSWSASNEMTPSVPVAAIGPQTAAHIKTSAYNNVLTADSPSVESVIDLLNTCLND